MAPFQTTAKSEREKKLKAVLAFASNLTKRLEDSPDTALLNELQVQIRGLPLQTSSTLSARQNDLDKIGTELWNLSTRLRRDEPEPDNSVATETGSRSRALCLLRAFAFLLLDSAGRQGTKGRQYKSCMRLMKVALKAARVCIDGKEMTSAIKVLERAAEYQDVLGGDKTDENAEEAALADCLRAEYFALRTTLAWRQDRMDMAEHMFTKCKQLANTFAPATAEKLADLFYEIGKDALTKRDYDVAVRWLERAYDELGEQDLDMLSLDIGELRLSTMQSIVQANMKLRRPEAQDKAWQMVKLMETDFGDKMVVSLLKIELLSDAETVDTTEFYNVLLRMIRTTVLNDTNFKTIMHYIHKLKERSSKTACKALDDLIDIRLFREEKQTWLEKAVITRIWISTSLDSVEGVLEQLEELFGAILQNWTPSLTAPATHAAQTLLWKQVEATCGQEQHDTAEKWCRLCLHPVFDKAGAQNKVKVARKIIQCALSRQDCPAAREAHSKMPDTGRDEPVTRYLMYKVGLRSGDAYFAAECLDLVCRSSAKDATLLYACVMEAQNFGNKRQTISALERVLDRYNYSAPSGIHLPALLRCTARLLQSELIKDGAIDPEILGQLCTLFEGAYTQAKASRRRPSTSAQEFFTAQEFEWFSKNAYNLSLKHCAEMPPSCLVRLLSTCTEFIKLLKEQDQADKEGDFCLRLVFCEFLAACTYTTLARAEDNTEQCLQYYLEARNHSQEFRQAAAEGIDRLGGSAQADIMSKHFQVVKLELEAVLKLSKWDELDELFDQCWKYKSPDRYETLADLVLVIHSCIVKEDLDVKYQSKLLSVLQKIINLTCRQPGIDMTKLSRWLRCLFNLSLGIDENTSLKCIEQVTRIAATRQGDSMLKTPPQSSDPLNDDHDANPADVESKDTERYPKTELEWLATTSFNRAIDYYMQENDEKCKTWAEKSFVLAQWLEDDGAVRDLLMDRFAKLSWDK